MSHVWSLLGDTLEGWATRPNPAQAVPSEVPLVLLLLLPLVVAVQVSVTGEFYHFIQAMWESEAPVPQLE